jgi:hypothetical protein
VRDSKKSRTKDSLAVRSIGMLSKQSLAGNRDEGVHSKIIESLMENDVDF